MAKKKLSEMSEEEINKLSDKEYEKLKAEQDAEEAEEAAAEEAKKKKASKLKKFTMRRNRIFLNVPENDTKKQFKNVTIERDEFHANEEHYTKQIVAIYGSKEAALESGEFVEATEAEIELLKKAKAI